MFELGTVQTLYIDHKTAFGVYLGADREAIGRRQECILLPKKQVPAGAKIGDAVEVFIYKDSDDRYIATTKIPMITIGKLAVLEVVQVNKIGAFLYWGLEKDLFLPYSEQIVKVQKGGRYLVALYIDKSERLCATMKNYDLLSSDSPYKEGDTVEGIVIGKNPDLGVFVAVDNQYHAMIQNKEATRPFRIGDPVHAKVLSVRQDGKLNLGLREAGYIQMDIDAAVILERLKENQGYLPYHDKSSPDEIREVFEMSKNEFKRAIGKLYREKVIVIEKEGIRLIHE